MLNVITYCTYLANSVTILTFWNLKFIPLAPRVLPTLWITTTNLKIWQLLLHCFVSLLTFSFYINGRDWNFEIVHCFSLHGTHKASDGGLLRSWGGAGEMRMNCDGPVTRISIQPRLWLYSFAKITSTKCHPALCTCRFILCVLVLFYQRNYSFSI